MEGGFIADQNQAGSFPIFWVAGAVNWSFWGGVKLRGRRQLYVATRRCVKCGYLELYAPERKA